MNTKSFRIVGGPAANPPTTDFLDTEVNLQLASSGAYTNGNVLLQGTPVCADVTSLVTSQSTTPVMEQAVLPLNSTSAGAPLGVYQGATVTNASVTASSTIITLVRKMGYGLVNAGGVTTSVTVGGVLSILPGSTPAYASQLAPAFAATQQAQVYYIGATVATGARTTIGAIAVTASTTTQALVNAYINTLG